MQGFIATSSLIAFLIFCVVTLFSFMLMRKDVCGAWIMLFLGSLILLVSYLFMFFFLAFEWLSVADFAAVTNVIGTILFSLGLVFGIQEKLLGKAKGAIFATIIQGLKAAKEDIGKVKSKIQKDIQEGGASADKDPEDETQDLPTYEDG
jgi:hypothetical protein